jgi:arylsulfatase
VWELYHVATDASECHDLAEAEPQRLQAMIDRWWAEAEAHGVLPLDDRTVELFGVRFREHSPHPLERRYTYRPPMAPLPAQVGPPLGGRSWEMAAEIDRPDGANGVLFASGTENSGISFFVDDDHLVFDYNFFGVHTLVVADRPVPVGPSIVGVRFDRAGPEADVTLVIDGVDDATVHLDQLMNIMSSVGPSVGYDHGSPVSERYAAPNPFAGVLRALHVDADPAGRHRPDGALALSEYLAEMGRQ